MPNFDDLVTKALPRGTTEVLRTSGHSMIGQQYTIVVTKVLWYKIRLFLEEDHLDKHKLKAYHSSQHATRKGVDRQVSSPFLSHCQIIC